MDEKKLKKGKTNKEKEIIEENLKIDQELKDTENIKKNNYQEYVCGKYEEGRYAWVLENIEPLGKPIKAKGHLSIWNYDYE